MAWEIIVSVHILSLAILVVLIVALLVLFKSTKREFLVLFVFSVFVYVLGTMFEIMAFSLDAAVFGIYIRALGGTFMLPLFLVFVQEYCEVRLPKAVNYGVFITAAFNTVIVWTSQWHDLFYTYLFLYPQGAAPTVRVWGFSHGVLYPFVFVIHPAICGIFTTGVVVYTMRKHRFDMVKNNRLWLGLFIAIIPVTAQAFDLFQITFMGMYNTALVIPITAGLGYFTLYMFGLHENEETIRSRNWLKAMIANISHDLKTPLTILSLHIENLLNASLDDPKYHRDVQIVYNKNLDLQRLIENLIEVTRIDSAQSLYTLEWISLNAVLSDIQKKYGDYLESVGLYLDIEGHGSDVLIWADPSKIWSVFDNVIYNAARHTREGGISITAKAKAGKAAVTITDTGCGIAPEHLPHVFERFYKADNSCGGKGGDSGLGLYIVRNIMENFHGEAEIMSEEGVGTAIILSFGMQEE